MNGDTHESAHRTLLREIAYGRSGDKGDTSNIVIVPYDEDDYEWLVQHLTTDIIHERFRSIVKGGIVRYEMPGIRALNFVLEHALQGGVSKSLDLDAHGKSWANLALRIELVTDDPVPSRARH